MKKFFNKKEKDNLTYAVKVYPQFESIPDDWYLRSLGQSPDKVNWHCILARVSNVDEYVFADEYDSPEFAIGAAINMIEQGRISLKN